MRILEGWARLGLWTEVPPVWMYYWKCLVSLVRSDWVLYSM